ncbi:MAG: glycoside hydrolase family 97 protein [Bacteroidales bacterium]|nr:glycoside hydrolase family 97 protein [Bacteroidales bacterium]
MKNLLCGISLLGLLFCSCDNGGLISPNGKVEASICEDTNNPGTFYLLTNTLADSIRLGFNTEKESFSTGLSLIGYSAFTPGVEDYVVKHGKRLHPHNEYAERTFNLKTANNKLLDVIVRVYNDGLTFRYALPEIDSVKVVEESTTYNLPASADRWLMPLHPNNMGYEQPFPTQHGVEKENQWGYPCLFNSGDKWALIAEADIDESFCATRLDNNGKHNKYQIALPQQWEARETGEALPVIAGKWQSPWRVVVSGSLADIFETTLIEDASRPSVLTDDSWVKPGRSAWAYWSHNHGSLDFKVMCSFVDLAKNMGWEYFLIDWEWDRMANGGNLQDLCQYAQTQGVELAMWYNSGGNHTWVDSTPKDRMLTHENRVEEFTWLKSLGIKTVKVDFFESDKQWMMKYYLDILKDAADYQMMVDFHGCTSPRGWSRTYPHLMSMEGIYGAEWYNNRGDMTIHGAEWNTISPFTRNVVGPMDYTPVAFTHSQHPHTTTNVHELALATVYESGIQHWADRPEGFYALPDEAKQYMSAVPAAWTDSKLIAGYPSTHVVVARRSGNKWYIAGINGTDENMPLTLNLSRLDLSSNAHVNLLITDGPDTDPSCGYPRPENFDIKTNTTLPESVSLAARGGFVMVIED